MFVSRKWKTKHKKTLIKALNLIKFRSDIVPERKTNCSFSYQTDQ